VNLTGDYVWGTTNGMSENNDGMRPLRPIPDTRTRAA
jgi:hypothetical protein